MREDWFGADAIASSDKSLLEKICSSPDEATADDICPRPKNDPATRRVAGIPSPKRPENKKGVLARMSIMPKMQPGEPSIKKQGQTSTLQTEAPANQSQAAKTFPVDMPHDLLGAVEVPKANISEVLHQPAEMLKAEKCESLTASSSSVEGCYATAHEILLQTLYTSKSTLAYFAKSTLARTRATLGSFTTASISDLAEFYRNRLITSKKMDVKYRDTIPKIIESAILQVSPTQGGEKPFSKCSRKKLSSRKKLGKDGLYAGEEAFIRTWWLNRDVAKNDSKSVDLRDQAMQALLKELRNRETQLQIILILEILTLELKQDVKSEVDVPIAGLKEEPDDDDPTSVLAKTPSKINKKRDLRPDLDILVDRLCIYQSVSTIEPITTDAEKKQNGGCGNEVSDKLRDFCCNVILPFYRHKAPDLVKEISRKLGGPNLSPKRPIPSRATSGVRTKSGTANDTHRRSIPRRTLERVLSEEQSSRQSSPPMLMRSATAPMGGSGSLDSVETISRPSSRGSLHKSHSFTNRQVDLVASSNAHNAKRKKLANLAKQKEELDAAIHALKKPNRGLVGMEIMAEAEKRREERASSCRSTLGRSSSDQSHGVQITATPRKGENLGGTSGKESSLNQASTTQVEDRAHLMLGEPVIPSSTVKPVDKQPSQLLCKNSDAVMTKRAIHPAVHETPSRGSFKTSNPLSLATSTRALWHPSPPATVYSAPHPPLIQATPSTNRLRADLAEVESTPLRMTKSNRPVTMFQSLKKAEVTIETAFRDAPIVSVRAGKAMQRAMHPAGAGVVVNKEASSIYASLGWDDEVDDLL